MSPPAEPLIFCPIPFPLPRKNYATDFFPFMVRAAQVSSPGNLTRTHARCVLPEPLVPPRVLLSVRYVNLENFKSFLEKVCVCHVFLGNIPLEIARHVCRVRSERMQQILQQRLAELVPLEKFKKIQHLQNVQIVTLGSSATSTRGTHALVARAVSFLHSPAVRTAMFAPVVNFNRFQTLRIAIIACRDCFRIGQAAPTVRFVPLGSFLV